MTPYNVSDGDFWGCDQACQMYGCGSDATHGKYAGGYDKDKGFGMWPCLRIIVGSGGGGVIRRYTMNGSCKVWCRACVLEASSAAIRIQCWSGLRTSDPVKADSLGRWRIKRRSEEHTSELQSLMRI